MKFNSRKAITLFLMAALLFSLFSFSTATFAANEKVSSDLAGKIKANANSIIPVIVQTKQGLQKNHTLQTS